MRWIKLFLIKQQLNYINQSYTGYYILINMDETRLSFKKRWTLQEDKALRQIKENLRYKSWNIIAKKMATQFGFVGRSQKQCRDRYQNYLKSKDNEFEWTRVEEEKMFKMFVKEGSRWELISGYFSNIKGIHIKNKFYTRVRKAIRQVNAVIEFYYSKKYSLFEFSVISKLVSKISKNVQELKYDKCPREEHVPFDKYTKTLFQLIELTNQEEYEVFPQLGIKNCTPLEKKKLFKKLIKTLKSIELQNSKLYKSEDLNLDSSNVLLKWAKKTDDRDSSAINQDEAQKLEKRGRIQCNYKTISNQQKDIPNHLRIICRIKKTKLIQKPPKQELKITKNHSDLSDQEEMVVKEQRNQAVKLEHIQKPFQCMMDLNHIYPLVSEQCRYFKTGLQLGSLGPYYNFN